MLNIDSLEKGLVIDHIQAGKSMEIYRVLELDKLDCSVAIIKNARSKKPSARTSSKSKTASTSTWMCWALLTRISR